MNGRKIAHAGGAIDGIKYSNSLNAIRASAAKTNLIELDIVMAADGAIVAHDGHEEKYGVTGRFDALPVSAFRDMRYSGQFQSLSIYDLALLSVGMDCKFILDIKPKAQGYKDVLVLIAAACQKFGVFDKFIIQVYSRDDFYATSHYPFHGIMIAFWKNFRNIFSQSATRFFRTCVKQDPAKFIAASVNFKRIFQDGKIVDIADQNFFRGSGVTIFIHGQPKKHEAALLDAGYGLFTHTP
ncbi:MAG: hypothetical protein WBC93_00170 [Sulfitobacter sp.]